MPGTYKRGVSTKVSKYTYLCQPGPLRPEGRFSPREGNNVTAKKPISWDSFQWEATSPPTRAL